MSGLTVVIIDRSAVLLATSAVADIRSARAGRLPASRSSSVCSRMSGFTGLARCSRNPAASARSRSARPAYAVSATRGSRHRRSQSIFQQRDQRVAVLPGHGDVADQRVDRDARPTARMASATDCAPIGLAPASLSVDSSSIERVMVVFDDEHGRLRQGSDALTLCQRRGGGRRRHVAPAASR